MSFRTLIQDMSDEIGSFRLRSSRSLRVSVVHEEPASIGEIDALKQNCWANLPPELLRDVLVRIEESEATWPPRKDVVACAGVCRSWRDVMKEIVNLPEIFGKLTFPISLKQV
jgi:tubby and related proteins